MPTARDLRPDERAFLGLLAATVYANAFGSDRERLGRLLGREIPPQVVSQAGYYRDLVPALDARLAALGERGLGRLDQSHPEDQALMHIASGVRPAA